MKLMVKITLFLFLVILIILIPSVTILWNNQHNIMIEQANIRAKTIHEMIIATRQWILESSQQTKPISDTVIEELAKHTKYMTPFRFYIISDKLNYKENIPTKFEERAVNHIKNGFAKEYVEFDYEKELGDVYKYAAPLSINKSCLKCHEYQDYRVKDLREIISITVPIEDIKISLIKNNNIIFYTIIISLFTIAVMITLSIYLLAIRHLSTLTKAAKEIQKGNMVETKLSTNDEIENLSEAFDIMSRQIKSNEDNLKSELDNAVAKYVDLVKELEVKNEKLGSLNNLKTELLDSIAHEIRTPLTKILAYSDLLNNKKILEDDKTRNKFTISMKTNINIIKNMFNDIITLSRLEHEQYTYHYIPVRIYNMINDIIEIFELEVKNKNIHFEINISNDDIIYVDGETFSIAVSNIISNAIKYSKHNGKVTISGYKNANQYIIVCKDNGIGIPNNDLEKIFFKFHRSANVKKEFQGTGLGLSIVKRIISAHGGLIKAKSKIDKYTEITLIIPLIETTEKVDN